MSLKATTKAFLVLCAVILAALLLRQVGISDYRETLAIKTRYQTAVASKMVVNNAVGDSIFGVPDVAVTPLRHSKNVQSIGSFSALHAERQVPVMGTIQATPTGECQTQIEATAVTGAMVDLEIGAACQRNAYFVIRHMDMVFSGKTDDSGHASVLAPALSENAVFTVFFDNVESGTVAVWVPDVQLFHRAILQWRGSDNLQLHALEFGARIGDPGHVWSASSADIETAIAGESGFMMRLGTSQAEIPYMAEVYTYPTGPMKRDGTISLLVGAILTDENCGGKLDASATQTNKGNEVESRELVIPMPNCDASDRSVLLPNMFENLTLTAH